MPFPAIPTRRSTSSRLALATRALQAGFVGMLVLVWHAVTTTGVVSPLFLPQPLDVVRALWAIVLSGEANKDIKVTLYELVVAGPLAIAAGTLTGWLISTTRYATQVLEPVVAALYAIPIIIFYPISVLVFGVGPESKIAHGALFGFFPVCLNTIQGFSRVDPSLLRLAASLGAGRSLVLRRILLPAAMPTILSGWRMGLMLCFLAIIGSETIASLDGLGHRIVWYAEGLHTTKMFAFILLVIGIVVAVNWALSWLEPRRWDGADA